MHQTKLVQYRQSRITPDLAEALRRLEARAAEVRDEDGNQILQIEYRGPKPDRMTWAAVREDAGGPLKIDSRFSMIPAGREVYLRVHYKTDAYKGVSDEQRLATLWGLAVPLGFTPWNRYPMGQETDNVFHYFGPWHMVYDHLCGEGRGELGFPSLACAAQLEVGAWEGNKPVERYVQAQLHRLGRNPGAIDGMIGARTQNELRGVGLQGMPLTRAAEQIAARAAPKTKRARVQGHVMIPDQDFNVAAFGDISTMRTPNGVALTIDGPGRVVVDVTGSQG